MLVLSFFVLPLVFGTPIPAPGSGCAAVHIITARASTEPPGEGIIGAVADDIVNSSAQPVSREAVDYPATLIPYASSEAAGVQAMNSDLAAQVKLCPSQKIVLLGYSQGAHVTGDVLASNASGIERVAAVILMGDPAHVAGESFQKGTGNSISGVFAREPRTLEPYASRIASFCDRFDEFCQSNGNPSAVHRSYVRKYGTQATQFVLSKIGG